MDRTQYLTRELSRKQKEAYAQICDLKHIRAFGQMIKTCRILLQFGLIKPNPNSNNVHDYVLNGKPLAIPIKEKLPLKKDVIQESKESPKRIEFHHVESVQPTLVRPAADHTNLSREDHISKWLKCPVKTTGKAMIKVKCLNDDQMRYIMANHDQQTAQAMAEHLKVEKYRVNIFCQANDIEPFKPARKHKPKDDYHCIPPERKLRMARKDYNGPQKKTA